MITHTKNTPTKTVSELRIWLSSVNQKPAVSAHFDALKAVNPKLLKLTFYQKRGKKIKSTTNFVYDKTSNNMFICHR